MKSDDLYKVLNKLGFIETVDNLFDKVIIMEAKDAFIFSSITGAKYMIYENGITMKGRYEVFIHRSVFSKGYLIYSPGLFGRDLSGRLIEGDCASSLKERFPNVFSGKKKIVIIDVDKGSNIESSIYKRIIDNHLQAEDYVIYKNFNSKNTGESFLEYIASIYFSRKGFLTENQTPWFQQKFDYKGKKMNGGIPDFSAFKCRSNSLLYSLGIINEDGIPLSLIPVYKNFIKIKPRDEYIDLNNEYELLIGEAKTSKTSLKAALKQLEKYDAVDLADELFTIMPDSDNNDSYGSLFIDSQFNICYSSKKSKDINQAFKKQDNDWLDTYIKALLLGNLPFNKVIELINMVRNRNNMDIDKDYEDIHLLDALQNISNKEFFEFFKEALNGIH